MDSKAFDSFLRTWDQKSPLPKDAEEYLYGVAKEFANGDLLYDPKTKSFCLVKSAPKHLLKNAKRDGGLLVVQHA